MTLWFLLLVMTAGAVFAVLWPLGRRKPLRTGSDIAVYRDQLEEIERDRFVWRRAQYHGSRESPHNARHYRRKSRRNGELRGRWVPSDLRL